MRLIIVRHGETVENAAHIIQGQFEGMLNDRGKQQAHKLCNRLLKEPIDVIYCSDLQRCKDTIAPYLAQRRKIPIHYTPALREKSYGIFEGRPVSELLAWREQHPEKGYYQKPTPQGESNQEVLSRAKTLLQHLYTHEAGKNVLLVTHGAVKLALLLYLLRKDTDSYEAYRAPNTGVTILHVSDDKAHHAECVNCVKHLD